MICNSKMFGRAVEVKLPEKQNTEIMIFQGMTLKNVPSNTGFIETDKENGYKKPRFNPNYEQDVVAICENTNGILYLVPIDNLRFLDDSTRDPIYKYTLTKIPEERFNKALVGRTDIFNLRFEKVEVVDVIRQTRDDWDLDIHTEWYEAYDQYDNTYKVGDLLWKGDER